MSTANTRRELGEALSTALGKGFSVFPSDEGSAPTTRPTLYLERSAMAPEADSPMQAHLHEHTFTLWVVVPLNAGQDALDDALDAVIAALEDKTQTVWTDARRGIWGTSNPSFAITLTAHEQPN